MARLKLLDISDVGPIAKEMYQKSIDATGKVINLFRVLSHSEKIARDWNRLGTTLLRKGKLPADLRELAIIRVGELAQSQYELTAHRAIGLNVGLTQSQIDVIGDWQGKEVFSDAELAVLQYTDEVALDIAASDESFDRLKNFFTSEQIVELTVNIGFYGMVVRTLESLQVDAEA
jgi:alkylhydroperoxidase family enzyme